MPNIRKITSVLRSEKFCGNAWTIALAKSSIWGKSKMFKNMRKTSLRPRQKCSTQKPSPKTPNIRKIPSVRKSEKFGIMHGPLQNRQFGSKRKLFKNMQKTSLGPRHKCSTQNPLQKRPLQALLIFENNKCSKIGKIFDNAWAIAFANSSIWVKNHNVQKHAKNNKTRFFYVLYCDKTWFNEPVREREWSYLYY